MDDRRDLLRLAMLETQTSQSQLARLSGVHQPSISQFLSGRIDVSDEQLDRLLGCMGRRLEVVHRVSVPDLTRSERRSWQLHRMIASRLDTAAFAGWQPTMRGNLEHLRGHVVGQPHERNLDRWTALIDSGDLGEIKRRLTGLDRDSIEMREVSPMRGLLSQEDRALALAQSEG
jgi:transcriptional regulator with XRE-family HTH domain